MEEEWRKVKDFEDRFEVSSLGRLRNLKGKILSQYLNKNGYLVHATKVGGRKGKAFCLKIHRLVAEAFLGEPEQYQLEWATKTHYKLVFVNHIDKCKTNNRWDNLEWCTNRENILYSLPDKNEKRCYQRSGFKLNKQQCQNVRDFYLATDCKISLSKLAIIFGVSRRTISTVLRFYGLNNPKT